ncbi:type VI secretion system lipoprotein TssJ [Alteromonadaceae bacterium BrNp21-10]|nr:type VI secretion system lipoprotein TssJ [Alteromonadaceae bacterium BrNp21-10]
MVNGTHKLMTALKLLVLSLATTLLLGCGATNAVKDVFTVMTRGDITVVAANNVNPDINGRPSPIMIRVFELKSTAAFNNADFFALYDRGSAELGSDYVSHDDMDIKPGQTKQMSRDFSLETRYFGVIAAYRDINNATWKRVVTITPDSDSEITISLNSNDLKVTIE